MWYVIIIVIITSLSAAYLFNNADKYKIRLKDNSWGLNKNNENPDMYKVIIFSLLIGIPWIISLPAIVIFYLGMKLFNKKSPQQNTKQI